MIVDGVPTAVSVSDQVGSTDNPSIELEGEAPGTYEFTYIFTNANGCSDTSVLSLYYFTNDTCSQAMDLGAANAGVSFIVNPAHMPPCFTLSSEPVPSQ